MTLVFLIVLSRFDWIVDAQGRALPRDFLALYAAGVRGAQGHASLAYDWSTHNAFQQALIGGSEPIMLGFFYPPSFLFVLIPFSALGYAAAAIAFLAITFCLYAGSLRLILKDSASAITMALAFGASFACVVWAQAGLLTGSLLIGGLALLERRPRTAGILFGLLTIKPHLGVLLAIGLLIGRQWRAIASAAATSLALAFAAEIAFGPGAWAAFLQSTSISTSFLIDGRLQAQSLFVQLLPLVGPWLAGAAHALFALAALSAYVWIARQSVAYGIKASALVSATLLLSPYIYCYDAVMLTGAAAFLIRDVPRMGERDHFLLVLFCMIPAAYSLLPNAAVPIAAGLMLCFSLHLAGAKWLNRSPRADLAAHQQQLQPVL